jgi:hypothetical protein
VGRMPTSAGKDTSRGRTGPLRATAGAAVGPSAAGTHPRSPGGTPGPGRERHRLPGPRPPASTRGRRTGQSGPEHLPHRLVAAVVALLVRKACPPARAQRTHAPGRVDAPGAVVASRGVAPKICEPSTRVWTTRAYARGSGVNQRRPVIAAQGRQLDRGHRPASPRLGTLRRWALLGGCEPARAPRFRDGVRAGDQDDRERQERVPPAGRERCCWIPDRLRQRCVPAAGPGSGDLRWWCGPSRLGAVVGGRSRRQLLPARLWPWLCR